MIQLLITVVVFALVCYVLFWLLGYLAVPEPIRKVVVVVVVLIAVVLILSMFAGNVGLHSGGPLIH
jgi:hypothetical protein